MLETSDHDTSALSTRRQLSPSARPARPPQYWDRDDVELPRSDDYEYQYRQKKLTPLMPWEPEFHEDYVAELKRVSDEEDEMNSIREEDDEDYRPSKRRRIASPAPVPVPASSSSSSSSPSPLRTPSPSTEY